MGAVAESRDAILQEWLEQTFKSYPEQTARFYRGEKDPFRNPVGHALRDGLAALLDELLGEMNEARVSAALDSIVRIRAVQDFTASQAVAFLFPLRDILRDKAPERENRLDCLIPRAFDLYVECREKIFEIQANEARRRCYLPERVNRKRGEAP